MNRIKKNDIVQVISGKDKDKTGRVVTVYKGNSIVLVEGVNLVKKHMRPTRDNQQGGIVQIERPISISKVMPFCKNCNSGVRIGYNIAKDKAKVRFCKKCRQTI